ncbi:hypothetical protein JOC76_001937 [Neobacillus cucumis]|nr:hypothetical protein [Neobacillus cucumis]
MNIGQGSTKKIRWCLKLDEHRTREGLKDEAKSEAE